MTAHSKTSIRQEYKEQTRARILEAALALMAEEDAPTLTIAAVGERAGVTQRTVYRHFATREALLEAVWPRMQARIGSPGFPRTADELIAAPGTLFAKFDAHATLVCASAFSEGGREVRLRGNAERQTAFAACVADGLPHLSAAPARRRAAIVQLLDSVYAWALLKDFWDMDGAEAGRAAGEAIAILLGRQTPDADQTDQQGERTS